MAITLASRDAIKFQLGLSYSQKIQSWGLFEFKLFSPALNISLCNSTDTKQNLKNKNKK